MCDNCVAAGRMTQSEADEQAAMFETLLSGPEGMFSTELTPEDLAMVTILAEPYAGRVVLGKFLTALEVAGWAPAVVKNNDDDAYAFAFVHNSGQGGAFILCELSEEAAKAIEKQFRP